MLSNLTEWIRIENTCGITNGLSDNKFALDSSTYASDRKVVSSTLQTFVDTALRAIFATMSNLEQGNSCYLDNHNEMHVG